MPYRYFQSELIRHRIGTAFAIVGTGITMAGALVNNLLLEPVLSRWIWLFSNPVFLAYFIGVEKGWWTGNHIGTRLLILTYIVYSITNVISVMLG
jgi:hypothetical protein